MLLPIALAVSLSITPSFVRLPLGSNASFEITVYGEGKTIELRAIGPYLSWYEKKVWVPPSGKRLSLIFSPKKPGNYSIKVYAGSSHAEAKAEVYEFKEPVELWQRIQELKKVAKGEELEKILEAEALYNQSKYELARLKLEEVEIPSEASAKSYTNFLPLLILAFVLGIFFYLASKLFLP